MNEVVGFDADNERRWHVLALCGVWVEARGWQQPVLSLMNVNYSNERK